jgi:aminopeptidase N
MCFFVLFRVFLCSSVAVLRRLLFCAAAMALGMTIQRGGDDVVPAAGVPLSLAEERSAQLTHVRYELHFTIPASSARAIEGRVVITFTLRDAVRPVVLDFAAPSPGLSVRANGLAADVTIANEHIVIPPAALRPGENQITIDFIAGEPSLNRNPEFMYALFVPARARLAFPCFDQPDIKAKFQLTLEIPKDWEALSNGAETARATTGNGLRLQFAETEPLPTYLFAFAAGKFQIEVADRGGRQFRMFHRETDAQKVARNRDAIFDLHAAALSWLEDYTAIPYPWGKFDFLLVPSFQFGGMEHAGAIFYNASALLLDPSATVTQKLGRASLIAHETAHMWFGDLVTMRWFNDVWMKEVFANFMAAKIVNPSFPEINHDLRFLLTHYPGAYDVDRTPGTNAIRQRLDNLNEAGSLYGAIIYQKAPIVMRQLEMTLGVDNLRDGLRQYLRNHSFANASWTDLIALLDERTSEDLSTWSHAWVEERGRPLIATELTTNDGVVTTCAFKQRDPIEGRGLLWSQLLDVAVGHEGDTLAANVRMSAQSVPCPVAVPGSQAPLYVLPAARGIAYGNFVLDPATRTYLLAHLPERGDPVLRGSALVILWEEMIDGRVRPSSMLDTLARALPLERDDLNLQRMLSYTQQAYWRWIPANERQARAATLEAILRSGLDAAATQSRKSAWFSTLRDTALTPERLQWLERVWNKEETVAGLELAEPDFISLALELAVRGVPRWQAILDQQHERIQNPDRKARFAFVRPALSGDAGTRDAFFETLKDVGNRRREPWVLEAVSYLHHPLRAAAAEKHIPASLALLPEIQRTGDIFFPKRWMDATLSGHSSVAASHLVAAHVASLPADYPDRLRRVILSSGDDLFRAARVR